MGKSKVPPPWKMGPGLGRKGSMSDVHAPHPFSLLLWPTAAIVDSSGVCSQLPSFPLLCQRFFSAPAGQPGSSRSLILPKGKLQPVRDGPWCYYSPDFPTTQSGSSELLSLWFFRVIPGELSPTQCTLPCLILLAPSLLIPPKINCLHPTPHLMAYVQRL